MYCINNLYFSKRTKIEKWQEEMIERKSYEREPFIIDGTRYLPIRNFAKFWLYGYREKGYCREKWQAYFVMGVVDEGYFYEEHIVFDHDYHKIVKGNW